MSLSLSNTTRSVGTGVPTRSVGTRISKSDARHDEQLSRITQRCKDVKNFRSLAVKKGRPIPGGRNLRLCGFAPWRDSRFILSFSIRPKSQTTQSDGTGIPTQSVGTRK
jgi:hypothetical protein